MYIRNLHFKRFICVLWQWRCHTRCVRKIRHFFLRDFILNNFPPWSGLCSGPAVRAYETPSHLLVGWGGDAPSILGLSIWAPSYPLAPIQIPGHETIRYAPSVKNSGYATVLWLIEYQAAIGRGELTCVGWQVTVCNPIWQVALRWLVQKSYIVQLFNCFLCSHRRRWSVSDQTGVHCGSLTSTTLLVTVESAAIQCLPVPVLSPVLQWSQLQWNASTSAAYSRHPIRWDWLFDWYITKY